MDVDATPVVAPAAANCTVAVADDTDDA
jgi:hypothetical protein